MADLEETRRELLRTGNNDQKIAVYRAIAIDTFEQFNRVPSVSLTAEAGFAKAAAAALLALLLHPEPPRT